MANLNGYPEICVICGRKRTCDDAGLCHECDQTERDAHESLISRDGWESESEMERRRR